MKTYINITEYVHYMDKDMNRDDKLEIRLTQKEKKKIREIAQKKGMDMSNYGRMKMLEPIKVEA